MSNFSHPFQVILISTCSGQIRDNGLRVRSGRRGGGGGGGRSYYAPRARTVKKPPDSPSDWVDCANSTRLFDLEMVHSLRGDMDTLLVFVGSEIIFMA